MVLRRQLLASVSRRELTKAVAASVFLGSWLSKNPLLGLASGDDGAGDPYSFADQSGLGPAIDAPEIERNYCPLHREKELLTSVAGSHDFDGAAYALRNAFLDNGKVWNDSYTIMYSFQHYGICDRSVHCERLLEYCEKVNVYLNRRIEKLVDVDLTWDLLGFKNECKKSRHNHFQGLVGRHTYYVARASAVNEAGMIEDPYVLSAKPVDRAINDISVNSDYSPARSLIFVIGGATSLLSPFSELIHLSMNAPALHHADELAHRVDPSIARQRAIRMGETVTEAAAILLATRFLERLGQTRRLDAIARVGEDLATRLPLLPKAMAVMRQNGVQESLSKYSDDPDRYEATLELV